MEAQAAGFKRHHNLTPSRMARGRDNEHNSGIYAERLFHNRHRDIFPLRHYKQINQTSKIFIEHLRIGIFGMRASSRASSFGALGAENHRRHRPSRTGDATIGAWWRRRYERRLAGRKNLEATPPPNRRAGQ